MIKWVKLVTFHAVATSYCGLRARNVNEPNMPAWLAVYGQQKKKTGGSIMKIQYYKTGKDDIKLLTALAPAEQLAKLSLAKYFGVYAVDVDEMTVVGLMICSYAREGRLDIEWLYVEEAYRNNEIGGIMLIMAYKLARHLGLPFVGVWMTGELAADAHAEAAREYFGERGFVAARYAEGDWVISSKDLRHSVLATDRYHSPQVLSMDKASNVQLKQFLRSGKASMEKNPLYTSETALADADPELSMVYYTENGQIDAVLLIQRVGGYIFPLAIHMRHITNEIFLGLASGAVQAILALPGNPVSRIVYSERAATLLAMIFQKLTAEPAYLLQAESSYDDWEDEPVDPDPAEVADPIAEMDFPREYAYAGYTAFEGQVY